MFNSGRYNVAEAEQSQHTAYANTMLCHVWLLDSTCVAFKVDKQCRGQALLDLTFDYLELLERDFFGLVFNTRKGKAENIVKWLDPMKKVRKQFSDRSSFIFWFRVRFYVPDPICLREEYTRYQFFLQVRKDILEGRLPVSKAVGAHLAGLALQSELGDFSADECRPGYVAQFRFMQQQTAEFETQASDWHRKSSSMLPNAAELEFLNVARQLDRYGVRTHDAMDEQDALSPVQVGVSFAGILVFRSSKPSFQLTWDNMVSIRFKGKKFIAQLKHPAATMLSSSSNATALSRTPSTSTLVAATAKSIGSSPVHTYRFFSAALVKSFWQYAVACHAFFRVREPVTQADGISRRLSFRDSAEPTSISATAVYAAISRATNGFRRFLSIKGGRSVSTASLSGSVGGVGRTLSTVMELRRSSQVFSRSNGRRSTKRSVFTGAASGTNQQNNTRVTPGSTLGAPHPIDAITTTASTRTYSQVPPSVAVPQAFTNASGNFSIKPPSMVFRNKSKKTPSPTAHELASGSIVNAVHSRSQPIEADSKPSSSRVTHNGPAPVGPMDRQTRSKSSKSGSLLRQSSRRPQLLSSDLGSNGDTNSPKVTHFTSQVKSKEKQPRVEPVHIDDSRECSDNSDRDTIEFDQKEAANYWSSRRAQGAIRPARSASKGRITTATPSALHESYHGRNETLRDKGDAPGGGVNKRTHAAELSSSAEIHTGITNATRVQHFRFQQTKSSRRSFDSNAAVKKEISTQSAAANWNSKTDAPSDSTGSQFVRDPFHPGAPAGGYRDPLDSGIECNEGLVRVRIRPDSHGRFGFNIRGGTDVGTPIIVSRVGQNMPADLCIPRLSEGDQLLSVNGRTVTRCTHAEVINLIRASKSDPAGLLELLVKQSDYVTDDLNGEALGPDSGDAPAIPPRTAQINSRQIGLGRLSNRTHRHSLSAQHLTTIAGRSTHAETKNSPLVQSMMELEVGLSDGSLLAQFEQLPRRKSGFTTNAARLTENEFKNRYRDISPYDQTRVILQRGPGDYINASFVIMDFPKAGFAVNYIAAQGPLLSTYGDFWQMCWEQHVTVIVMLTAVSERGRVKCHQYWPDVGQSFKFTTTAPIGPVGQRDPLNLQVQTMKEEVAGEFAFREFTLTQTASSEAPFSNECRRVEQLQHTSWPDHGTPSNMVELIEFVQRIREKRGKSTAPIVVHCSAGIGRTGVLIAMETAMNLMERAQPVRPIELVQLMRAQRALLIQTAFHSYWENNGLSPPRTSELPF